MRMQQTPLLTLQKQNLFTLSMWQHEGCLKEQIAASAIRGKNKTTTTKHISPTHMRNRFHSLQHMSLREEHGYQLSSPTQPKPQLETVVICYTALATKVQSSISKHCSSVFSSTNCLYQTLIFFKHFQNVFSIIYIIYNLYKLCM